MQYCDQCYGGPADVVAAPVNVPTHNALCFGCLPRVIAFWGEVATVKAYDHTLPYHEQCQDVVRLDVEPTVV